MWTIIPVPEPEPVPDFEIGRGDSYPSFIIDLADFEGPLPPGTLVEFQMRPRQGEAATMVRNGYVVDSHAKIIGYDWVAATDTEIAGDFDVVIRLTFGTHKFTLPAGTNPITKLPRRWWLRVVDNSMAR